MKKKVIIKESKINGAGRGVFAATDIKKGEVIEICPILIFLDKDSVHIMKTLLENYVYAYEESSSLFALGYGSLYNHSNRANAKYELLEHEGRPAQDSELYFTATKPIRKGEEIYINYGTDHYAKYDVKGK